ncbi:MAG: methionyl-tRNA formyltransferase, partial [Bacteroidota bacterium]|nr:methionyl-tRNA formyltransferase [Bacteroidota bacterium]
MPPLGTINVHGSLLPHYRGAAPINWAIVNGEQETGVTTFKLQHEIDTGNILLQQRIAIKDHETAGELHDEMKEVGAQLLLKTIQGLADGSLTEAPQLTISNHTSTIKQAPKITTETCKIDWNKPVDEVYNLIRGLSPYPTAFTFVQNKMLKIYNSRKEYSTEEVAIGMHQTDGKTFLKFRCSNGFIQVTDVQLEGKKRLLIEDFLRGFRM